jgi:hypothetical protein
MLHEKAFYPTKVEASYEQPKYGQVYFTEKLSK